MGPMGPMGPDMLSQLPMLPQLPQEPMSMPQSMSFGNSNVPMMPQNFGNEFSEGSYNLPNMNNNMENNLSKILSESRPQINQGLPQMPSLNQQVNRVQEGFVQNPKNFSKPSLPSFNQGDAQDFMDILPESMKMSSQPNIQMDKLGSAAQGYQQGGKKSKKRDFFF